jgi:RND family efflux transporter MFP subunit
MQQVAALDVAKRQLAWDKSRAESIRQLIDAIKAEKEPEEIRLGFSDQLIGDAREKLLSAYTDKLLAAQTVSRIASVSQTGAISSRVVDERKSSLDARQAALQSTIEQTLFDADRAAREAQIRLDDAQRRWQIAANRVTTLLGMSATAVEPLAPTASAGSATPADLSIVEVRAPRAGTIEKRHFNENERVQAGAVLFDIADTKTLWIQADIRESQWNALGLKAGQMISWSSPALPHEVFEAKIVMMGREVNTQTNAIALVASVDNSYGKLRPGLYVRVELPMGETVSQIVIPESAVATHNGQTFVFVNSEAGKFVRRDVRLGQTAASAMASGASTGNVVEVLAGLNIGEKIAVSGVFHLKSELLLEAEE